MEELIYQLIGELCQQGPLHSIPDVADRIQKTFPPPIDKWAMTEAQHATSKRKPSLVLPVDKIHQILKVNFNGLELVYTFFYKLKQLYTKYSRITIGLLQIYVI